MRQDDSATNRLRECEIGEELSYKEGKMPPAWTGKVQDLEVSRKSKGDADQSALIEKLTADLEEKNQTIEKLTADLEELSKPLVEKKLEQSNNKDK
jgi:uncharacterized coiled-coil protein SlyX